MIKVRLENGIKTMTNFNMSPLQLLDFVHWLQAGTDGA